MLGLSLEAIYWSITVVFGLLLLDSWRHTSVVRRGCRWVLGDVVQFYREVRDFQE